MSVLSNSIYTCVIKYYFQAQTGIKIARRNTNNFSYADTTTLMAESEEELESLLRRVKKLA